jgi:cytochrome c oxidase cbb3-type subunit 3
MVEWGHLPRSIALYLQVSFWRSAARVGQRLRRIKQFPWAVAALAFLPSPGGASEDDAASGRVLYEQHCSLCHGMNGDGGRGPTLRRTVLEHAANASDIALIVKQGIPPEMPEGWYYSERDLANLAAYVYALGHSGETPLPGDPARGEVVFAESGCAGCHIVDGKGNGYGPDLSNVGSGRGVDRLRETLLDPETSLASDFLLVEAVTEAGATIRGIRRNEDTLTIQIQDSKGQFYSLPKAQLRSLERLRGATPMPSYRESLSKQLLDDLVSYLATRRRSP